MSRGASRTSRPSPAPAGMPAWLVWKPPRCTCSSSGGTTASRSRTRARRRQRRSSLLRSVAGYRTRRIACRERALTRVAQGLRSASVDAVIRSGSLFADRYRIDEVLGTGAQKTTYLAWDTKAGRPVALAILSPDAQPAIGQHEAALLARVGPHDNIVTLYDFGVEAGRHFLALEYLPGGDLRDHCRNDQHGTGQLPMPEFFRWARQLCRSISQIHQYRIIHRDISATNIWLDARGVTHLGDFDTAVFLDDPQPAPHDFSTTESYPAPELLAGAVGDIRTDIYSLGAVFHELLTGTAPPAPTEPDVTMPPPSQSRDDVPASLDDLILSMLAEDPAARPASADAVLAALRKIEPTADLETLIANGENATAEFKQTMRWDIKASKTSAEVLKMAVKAAPSSTVTAERC